ncbi:hybrid sensor histidine kinase/response regulator [Bacteroides sp. Marseille-P8574]|uniref:ATP-binding response regulator n=1 Tax=Bacteroides sp. Marseille-P8574 TaxID=2697504 RepID=UPI00157BC50E|nr:hybrid sensor histidine kinase/response regulator [Bacteroides sp. Marseille-P8574]
MGLKLKIFFGYVILVLLSVFIVYQYRQEQMQRHMLRKEEKELVAIHRLTEKSYIGLLDLSTHAEIAITWDDDALREYSRKRHRVCDSLQLLKEYVHTPLQKSHIDSLCFLLWNKEILLSKTMHTFDELQGIGGIVQESIPPIILTVQKQIVQQEEKMTSPRPGTEDTPKKKRNIWSIFRRRANKSIYLQQREEAERKRQSLSSASPAGMTTRMLHSLDEKVTLEQAERQARLLAQMDSLYVGGMELNERMNSIVSEFERENNECFTARYRTFVLERNNSYYVVAGLALSISLLAIVLYILIHRDLNRHLRYEREFEQSNNRNRELLRSRKELMASVAHDLRAPLVAIRGCAEQLSSESDGSCRAGYLNNILHSSDYMLSLVDTLMEYHRMDEGEVYSKNTLFSLKTLFEEIADSHRLAARQKKLAFTVSFSGLDVMVNCDSSHIRQIVGNLLSNALKFTFHGKVLLEVEYRPGNLHISVLDTGMGIGLEEKKRIFGAFERLDNARNIPGFGLGLAITARLVSLMQGYVEVESVPGEGSRFSVFLPMLPAGHPVCPEEKFSPVCELPVDIRVLVIDDNRIQLEVISKMLSRSQIHCDCCTDVRELMNCLNKQKYDLLLTDIQMPGANGFSVLELLRTSNIPRAWEIPVIAITARSDKKGEYLTAGFADCLYKPFSEKELLAAVSQMDRSDFAAIMEGEENVEEMLDLFIKDTMDELAGIRDAFSTGDYKKLGSIIHKAAPLWEMIRINIPQSELREMASMPFEKWGGLSDKRIEELIKAVEHAVEKAKRIKKRVYGNCIDSRG